MQHRNTSHVSLLARAVVSCAALGFVAACSAAADESLTVQQEGLLLAPVRSVRILRPGALFSARALDSQNALPSGILADRLVRRRLELLARGNLRAGEGTLRSLPPPLVTYLVRCALDEGDNLALAGSVHTGRLGLVKDWKVRPAGLSSAERRWLTACLMAHTNDLATVDIAVAGDHGTFGRPTADDAPTWSFEEAAFYGDVFTEANASLFACVGAAAAARCDGGQVAADLQRRICGSRADDCRFTYTGSCSSVAPPVCDSLLPYKTCAERPAGSALAVSPRGQVMSVFLRTSADLRRLHPTATCAQ